MASSTDAFSLQLVQQLGLGVGGERETLEHRHRRRAVGHTEGEQAHGATCPSVVGAPLLVEREDLQLTGEVDPAHVDRRRHA